MVKLKITVKTKKMKCYVCKKDGGVLKFYILSKKHGTPKAYHVKCANKIIEKKS